MDQRWTRYKVMLSSIRRQVEEPIPAPLLAARVATFGVAHTRGKDAGSSFSKNVILPARSYPKRLVSAIPSGENAALLDVNGIDLGRVETIQAEAVVLRLVWTTPSVSKGLH